MSGGHPGCGQCGKPAIASVSGVNLCVDHYTQFQQVQAVALQQNMAMINHLEQEMWNMAGLPHLANKIPIPALPSGPMTFTNIKVENSQVGAINTGNVKSIDVSLTQLHSAGNDTTKEALQALTQAILDQGELAEEARNELLDHVAFIGSEAVAPPAERKSSVIKLALGALRDGAATVSGLAGAWTAAEPILKAHFGL